MADAPEDAFDVVIPSMPGYGFSGKPTDTGWGPDRIARAWAELMKRLGYTRYVAQGGDWGSPVSSAMARQAPAGLLGIHINLPAVVPPEIAAVLAAGGPAPAGLSEKERAAFDALATSAQNGQPVLRGDDGHAAADDRLRHDGLPRPASRRGCSGIQASRNGPTTTAILKSPLDEVLDDITLYWLTNTATSSARLYWEYGGRSPAFAAAREDRRDLASGGHHGLSRTRSIGPRRHGPGAPIAT